MCQDRACVGCIVELTRPVRKKDETRIFKSGLVGFIRQVTTENRRFYVTFDDNSHGYVKLADLRILQAGPGKPRITQQEFDQGSQQVLQKASSISKSGRFKTHLERVLQREGERLAKQYPAAA